MALTSLVSNDHLDEAVLFKLALGGRDARAEAHLSECRLCQRKFTKYADLVSVLKADGQDLSEKAARFERELPMPARQALRTSRAADERAAEIVACAKDQPEELPALLDEKGWSAAEGAFALVYACQASASLAGSAPRNALTLAKEVARVADQAADTAASLEEDEEGEAEERALLFSRARAEADLLASQAELYLQRTEAAVDAVRTARKRFEKIDVRPMDEARCDYFEGSALGFLKRYEEALSLLRSALRGFRDSVQEHWVGRAEAAIGLVMTQRSTDPRALSFFENALSRLDPELDATAYWGVALNRGTLLEQLGRFGEARQAYERVLSGAMKLRNAVLKVAARVNLAEVSLREGLYDAALEGFLAVLKSPDIRSSPDFETFSRLCAAECFAYLGRRSEMVGMIEKIRREAGLVAADEAPAFEELFERVDAGTLEAAVVSHVRAYVDERRSGREIAYQRYAA